MPKPSKYLQPRLPPTSVISIHGPTPPASKRHFAAPAIHPSMGYEQGQGGDVESSHPSSHLRRLGTEHLLSSPVETFITDLNTSTAVQREIDTFIGVPAL
ncbi:hypothetical protein Hypma_014613 [Hypsizygus marmoreus]|uniref:Uncharacterized protein n=1 Tax=Hypsizygus marmoreus TaxID=39966 RepID=A0A369JH74_HYPMA|nr:hypothetical protein Hypma_014613 [Hypsizygus marmoreus]